MSGYVDGLLLLRYRFGDAPGEGRPRKGRGELRDRPQRTRSREPNLSHPYGSALTNGCAATSASSASPPTDSPDRTRPSSGSPPASDGPGPESPRSSAPSP